MARIVYHQPYTKKALKTASLAEYVAFAPFSTVGIDNTFYAPPNPFVLQEYAQYLPEGFCCVCKVWEEITVPKWPQHKRYGQKAGTINPHFLSVDKFVKEILLVYDQVFRDHTGPLVFEFGQMYPPAVPSFPYFLEKLKGFLSELPDDFQYAIELRNPNFLKPAYFDLLREYNVAHVFNHWTRMPRLQEQMQAAGENPFTADFAVARLLTPLGTNYADAVKMNAPYDSLKQRLPAMREDIEMLIERAMTFNTMLYLLVNNRTEGCAPLTISEMDEQIRGSYRRFLSIHPITRKNIGHSHVLAPRFRNGSDVYRIAQKLLLKAAAKLRKEDFWTSMLHVRIEYTNRRAWYTKLNISACKDTLSLLDALSHV